VHLHPIGFGSETGEKLFNVPEVNSGVGKISNGDGQFKVNIQRLDDFVQKLNPSRIAFIKLIVEGFEPEVFKGGWNTIIKYKPPIFFEATDEWYQENNSSVESVVRSLAEMGYKFMGEYYNEMIPYDEKKFRDKYQYNVFAYGGS
jgi:hypothetical protein